jgi:hypothetical protein
MVMSPNNFVDLQLVGFGLESVADFSGIRTGYRVNHFALLGSRYRVNHFDLQGIDPIAGRLNYYGIQPARKVANGRSTHAC